MTTFKKWIAGLCIVLAACDAGSTPWPPPKPEAPPTEGIVITGEQRDAILDLIQKQTETIEKLKSRIEALQNGTGCT